MSYQPIRGSQIAVSGAQHTVAAGETLQMIARSVYGDGQLWYRIAEANGLMGDTDLVVGQTLVIPSNIAASANNADTWRPYDALQMRRRLMAGRDPTHASARLYTRRFWPCGSHVRVMPTQGQFKQSQPRSIQS